MNDSRVREITERELEGAIELLNRGAASGTASEFLLVIELLKKLRNSNDKSLLLKHDMRTVGTITGAGNVVERHLGRATTSIDEYNYLLITTAKKLLEIASVEIESKYNNRSRP